MRQPSPHQLRAFEACGRHGSFKLAAGELGLTPSAISHQIKSLETLLATQLFIRSNRDVRLTAVGQEYWEIVNATLEHLKAETRRLFGADQAPLKVLCSRSFLRNRLLPRIGDFFALRPEIKLDLPTFDRNDHEQLELANASAWIRLGRGKWPGRRSIRLMPIALFPMCTPAYLAAHGPIETPADLQRHRLICTSGRREEWNLWLRAAGVPVDAGLEMMEMQGETLDYQAALAGIGIAIGRAGFRDSDLEEGRLVRLFDIEVRTEDAYYLSYQPTLESDIRLRAFRDWLLGWNPG